MGQTQTYGQSLSPGGRMLEGVPMLAWGKSGDCTFIGALEAATAVTPYPANYNALMGATGLAFRVRWFQGKDGHEWCPSSPVGEMKDECEAATRVTGWKMRAEWGEPDRPIARVAPDIQASIDAGLPVLAYDDQMNMAVIVGYEDEGATIWMQDYFHGEELQRRKTADLAMFVYFLDEHTEPLSTLEAAKQGIGMAVRNEKRKYEPANGENRGYWHGTTALAKWAEDIGRAEELTDEERGTVFFVTWWNFEGLFDARRNAGPYLRRVAPLFEPEAAAALQRAADLYDREAGVLGRSFEKRNAFLGPWTGQMGENITRWTDDVRRNEQQILACAAEIERDALAELATALE